MTNLCRSTFMRKRAARLGVAPQGADLAAVEEDTAHEAVLRVLASHKSRLKAISSIEKKIEYKRTALGDIMPWVMGAVEGDRGAQDPVVAHALPWLLDVGAYTDAFVVGEYVLRHGLKMPDEYKRPPATVIAEVVADDALKALDTGAKPLMSAILVAIELTAGHDMHDQVRAKLHKAAGMALLPAELPTSYTDADESPIRESLGHMRRAFELHTQVGVKKPIERAERWLAEYDKRRAAEAAGKPNTTESASSTGAETGQDGAGDASAKSDDGGNGQPPPPAKEPAP
ncbi:phage terminase small subunit [Lysobacter brunescens]|uniref:Phage terminase small subunit n=1 Tax=Lysobacter brunescens TaxID=262323 RepID=A0ABW2YF23_9GAMM